MWVSSACIDDRELESRNTTHGSEWIVQARPTDEGRALLPAIPPTAVGGSFKSSLHKVPVLPLFLGARGERDNQMGCAPKVRPQVKVGSRIAAIASCNSPRHCCRVPAGW